MNATLNVYGDELRVNDENFERDLCADPNAPPTPAVVGWDRVPTDHD